MGEERKTDWGNEVGQKCGRRDKAGQKKCDCQRNKDNRRGRQIGREGERERGREREAARDKERER